ncbi:hypothetical protein [Nonomuraea fuscirosea]|uniref:hypothetical protein n=1 Tax=Nonomuraea fuscirosea TaxID=1291556 RepID=UPI0015E7B172|nr:hypothetical protein [Nonomuraea fuscirosea]
MTCLGFDEGTRRSTGARACTNGGPFDTVTQWRREVRTAGVPGSIDVAGGLGADRP